ncbi:MAG: EF-P lysine aminoacylase EpmA [Gammaproteobacteria bacterium]|nr:EF-P lysine aminoacylase EpmA [Gammaproteobacteria bacterium]
MQDWRPCASNAALRVRASLFADIRAFFAAREILEVDTPHLSAAGNTDPSLANFRLSSGGRDYFLATSPEFAMKRLLAAGAGDIYQLAHVFREAELGVHHNPEFMLLEWYRTGFELDELMNETVELVGSVGDGRLRVCPVELVEYRELFRRSLGIDPIEASLGELRKRAHSLGGAVPVLADERDLWLDWLMGAHVQPGMAPKTLTLVNRYPASQAALAQLHEDGITAQRFELFYGSLELANGYRELTDETEQRARFAAELAVRRARGLAEPPPDERFLAALPQLPPCCGVAVGVDRLAMLLLGAQRLEDVLSFAGHNA